MLTGAVIGLGRMGITHYSILNSHPDVRFVGVADPSDLVVGAFRDYLEVTAFRDFRELLEESKPDFVVVATPTATHTSVVTASLKAGAHVFVEKPFALSEPDARELVELASNLDKVNQVGYVLRFNDVVAEVKRLVDVGAIGRLISGRVDVRAGSGGGKQATGWRGKRSEGGGCLAELGSHALNLAAFFFGQPENTTSAWLRKVNSREVDDQFEATFLHGAGARTTVSGNWTLAEYRKPTYRIEIVGESGKIEADLHAFTIFLENARPDLGLPTGTSTRYITDFASPVRCYVRGNEFTRQLDYFIEQCCMANGAANISGFDSGMVTDRMLCAVSAGEWRTS